MAVEVPIYVTPPGKKPKIVEPSQPPAAAGGSSPSHKENRALQESSSDGPAHFSSDGRPSSRDHDASPHPISVVSLTEVDGEGEPSSNSAIRSGSTILFGHTRPAPGQATVTVLVTNTDEHGLTTSTTSTSETVRGTVATDWLDRSFALPPRKLVAQTQIGGQQFRGHHAPMPVNGQQFRRVNPPPPTTAAAAHPSMHPHNNRPPFPGNQAPAQFVDNRGQNGFHPARTYHPQPSWNTHPTANHPQQTQPPIRMVPAPATRFHPYNNRAPSHRVHASDAAPSPDFRVVDSTPICFDPYPTDPSSCVQAAEVSTPQQ